MSNKTIWLIIRILMITISIMVFTPLVIPKGVYAPMILGLPYTLWMGGLVYLSFLILMIIGVNVHSKIFKEDDND